VIDCVASDHAPHLEEEKKRTFLEALSGIPGLETLAPLLLTEVFKGQLTWAEYLRACSSGPALIVGLKNKGVLAAGFDADIMIIRKQEYQIEGNRFLSKAKITPFEGHTVLARPVTTIVEGQVVYSDGEFLVDPGVAGRVPLTKSVL
jgi:dihydroorotase-like cyclic amidohydrolase